MDQPTEENGDVGRWSWIFYWTLAVVLAYILVRSIPSIPRIMPTDPNIKIDHWVWTIPQDCLPEIGEAMVITVERKPNHLTADCSRFVATK